MSSGLLINIASITSSGAQLRASCSDAGFMMGALTGATPETNRSSINKNQVRVSTKLEILGRDTGFRLGLQLPQMETTTQGLRTVIHILIAARAGWGQ